MDLTFTEQKAFAIAPKPPAALSFLSSFYVGVQILRSPKKRCRLYHRLVLAMSINSLLQSTMFFWGTWAMPTMTPGVYGASGTFGTCTVQGFLVQFFLAVSCYYASLSLYSFLAVRNEFQQNRIAWIEPWIHLGAYLFPLVSAIVLLKKDLLNPTGRSVCWIAVYPIGCEVDENVKCIRGNKAEVNRFKLIFGTIPIICYLVFATSMMILLYCMEKRKEKENEGLDGKRHYIEKARRAKSKIVAKQALLYLAAFYLTYIFAVVSLVFELITGSENIYASLLLGVFISLQGFLNTIVYFRLQLRGRYVQKLRKNIFRPHKRTGTEEEKGKTFHRNRISRSSNHEKKRNGKRSRRAKNVEGFSIFDGTRPSEVWKDYCYSDDDNCDPYDYTDEPVTPIPESFESNQHAENDIVVPIEEERQKRETAASWIRKPTLAGDSEDSSN